MFRALDDHTRRLILDELAVRNDQSLFEICTALLTKYDIGSSRQAISQHLTLLEEAGLIRTERRGRTKLHHFDRTPLAAIAERWPIRKDTP